MYEVTDWTRDYIYVTVIGSVREDAIELVEREYGDWEQVDSNGTEHVFRIIRERD